MKAVERGDPADSGIPEQSIVFLFLWGREELGLLDVKVVFSNMPGLRDQNLAQVCS